MKKTSSFNFEIAEFSDLDYEGMTVEVRYRGTPIAQINKDKGDDDYEVSIPSKYTPENEIFSLPLDEFMEALQIAKDMLSTIG